MRTLLAFLLVTAIASANAFATSQAPDRIVYEGKEYSLHANPMEPYFRKHPHKRPRAFVRSTALWRGYVATFAFRDDALVLEDIRVEGFFGWKSVKNDIVPKGEDLAVDWFTGILELPHGERVSSGHGGYSSTYSDYLLLEITSGKLTGSRAYDLDQFERFKERQFEAYKKTDAYRRQAAQLEKEGSVEPQIDAVIRYSIMKYPVGFLVEKDASNPAGKAAGSEPQ